MATSTSQVKLQLTTRQTDLALPDESSGPILVSTSLRRYNLSRLVNELLSTPKSVPLEFLINGQFLRTSLDEYLTTNGISAESLLTVEYVRAIVPPSHVASYQHDDWVSAVDVLSDAQSRFGAAFEPQLPQPGHERVLSGCMDGQLRVWDQSSQVLAASAAADAPSSAPGLRGIRAARWLSPRQAVSAGYDRVVRIWNYSEGEGKGSVGGAGSASLSPHLELYGHKMPVTSIATHAGSSRILSASADHSVGVWSSKRAQGPPAPEGLVPARSTKRQKVSSGSGSSGQAAIQTAHRGPLAMLRGHTDQATAVAFHPGDATAAYSAGYDRTLRTWDLATGALVDTRTVPGGQAVLSLCPLPVGLGLVACGTAGRGSNVALIDPRAAATAAVALSLRGHTNPVSCIAAEPQGQGEGGSEGGGGGAGYGLVTGSYDSTCRVWDLRTSRAAEHGSVSDSVYTIAREARAGDNKVLDVCWDAAVGIVAGGEDMRVQINKGGSGAVAEVS